MGLTLWLHARPVSTLGHSLQFSIFRHLQATFQDCSVRRYFKLASFKNKHPARTESPGLPLCRLFLCQPGTVTQAQCSIIPCRPPADPQRVLHASYASLR